MALVPHTHWDREWYEPFQVFRMRLVDLLDDVLAQADSDPRFCFTLDGQTATIEDYLAIRPAARDRVRQLVAAGQLALGPWRILADEFLVSGETLIRNLAAGWESAQALGGPMAVGYLPDEFGHAAQLPQLLARAGIGDAVVWRGVPAAIGWHAFRWVAPDGSAVRCEYLPEGYGAAANLFDDAAPATALDGLAGRLGSFYGEGELLAPYGTDHTAPIPRLADAAAGIEGYDVRVTTLAAYIASRAGHGGHGAEGEDGLLPEWYGELRSHARANLLPGVTSARVGVKAAMARAERLLARYAEPLSALWVREWPRPFLALAWAKVIESSGHDSVTGCGSDAVAGQVLARLAEAAQIGGALRDRALAAIAARAPAGSVVAVNPSPVRRREVVELGDDQTGGAGGAGTAWADVPPLGWAVVRPTGAAPRGAGEPDSFPAVGAVIPSLAPIRQGDHWLDNGLLRVEVAEDGSLDVTARGNHWNAATLRGVARLVDSGDAGDLYNYCPPAGDVTVDAPETVAVGDAGSDLLRGRLVIDRSYVWPAEVVGNERSPERRVAETTTLVELRAGEPFLRLTVDVDNPCDDHRLRLHMPLARAAEKSHAEGQLAVVERPRAPEGGHGEEPIGTFPASGFVDAGGVAVLLDQPTEYELVDHRAGTSAGAATADTTADELALTVLRAVGRISRPDHPWRAEDAGPDVKTPGAQCHGQTTMRLAIVPHGSDWDAAGVVGLAERFAQPLVATAGTGRTEAPKFQPGLSIDGDGVALTSLRRVTSVDAASGAAEPTTTSTGDAGGAENAPRWLELRCVNESLEPTTARISMPGGIQTARQADLIGRPGDPLPVEGSAVHLNLAPWEIATMQLSLPFPRASRLR